MSKSAALTLLTLAALVAGTWFGQVVLFDPLARIPADHWTHQAGTFILVRPLLLLALPLAFAGVLLAAASIGSPAKLGLIGCSAIAWCLCTTLVAATLGAALAWHLRPGDLPPDQRSALIGRAAADLEAERGGAIDPRTTASDAPTDMSGAWSSLLEQIVPTNIVKEMAEGRLLGVILFAVLLGLALGMGGPAAQPAIQVVRAFFDALLRVTGWIAWLAPPGVFLLAAWTVGRTGFASMWSPIGKYALLAIAGLALHGLVVMPILLLVFGRTNPYRFLWRTRLPLLAALGSGSSSAAMPLALAASVSQGGCSKRAASFIVPVSAAINRNGSALVQALTVIFLCQAYGIDLQLIELLIVVLTAALAAISSAGAPGAGLAAMVIVIKAVNLSLAGRGQPTLPEGAIGVVIGVDRVLDMCRAAVDVWDDMVGAKIMTRLAPDPPREANALEAPAAQ